MAELLDLPVEIVESIATTLPYPSMRSLRQTSRRTRAIAASQDYVKAILRMIRYLRYFDIYDNLLVFIDNEGKVWSYELKTLILTSYNFGVSINQVWITASRIYAHDESGIMWFYSLRSRTYERYYDTPIRCFAPDRTDRALPYYVVEDKPHLLQYKNTKPILFNVGDSRSILQISGNLESTALKVDKWIMFNIYDPGVGMTSRVGDLPGFTKPNFKHTNRLAHLTVIPKSPVIAFEVYKNSVLILTLEGLYMLKAEMDATGVNFSSVKLYPDLRFISVHVGSPFISLITNTNLIYVLRSATYEDTDMDLVEHIVYHQQVASVKTWYDNLIAMDEHGKLYHSDLKIYSPLVPLNIGEAKS